MNAGQQQMDRKYKSSKQKQSRGQSRKKHQSDMNHGQQFLNGGGKMAQMMLNDPSAGSHTIGTTKYVNDYTTKQMMKNERMS